MNQVFKAVLRKDFISFLKKTFYTINPQASFSDNWHIHLLSEYLTEVKLGNIKRLIINIPPRSLKSICVNIAFPLWVLGLDPKKRIITSSYSKILSTKHALDSKLVSESSWYLNTFPDFKVQKYSDKLKMLTIQNGFRFATSIGSSITGEGGDILIVDDPHNPIHIDSVKLRKKAILWYEQVFSSRLNDPNKGAIIIAMQRLHEEDLCGYLTKVEDHNWTVLNIPAIADEDYVYLVKDKKYFYNKGTVLDKTRFLPATIRNIEKELGVQNFLAQYMQKPLKFSSLLSKNHINLTDEVPEKFDYYIQSFDTACKIKEYNDFSVCTTWGIVNDKYYLVNLFREKLIYPDLKMNAQKLINEYKPLSILIEDKSSGQSLIQDLKQCGYLNIIPIKPKLDKITRFTSIIELFRNGSVVLPKSTLQLGLILSELTEFPNYKNDDIVDSISQFLLYMSTRKYKTALRVRTF